MYIYVKVGESDSREEDIFVRRRAQSELGRKANRKVGRHVTRSNPADTLFTNVE